MKHCIHIVLGVFLLCFSSISWGQRITGKVYDNANKPITGVVVIETATQQGAATDLGGNYNINVKAAEHCIARA